MDPFTPSAIDRLSEGLNRLQELAPQLEHIIGTSISYRDVTGLEEVDDSLPSSFDEDFDPFDPNILVNLPPIGQPGSQSAVSQIEAPDVEKYNDQKSGPLVSIDCGIVRLGETENGSVIALRACIVKIIDSTPPSIQLFRTGPIYLHNSHKMQLLHQMGIDLGRPDQFVELDNAIPPQPIRVRSGVAKDSHAYGDRFRNWFERLVQQIAVSEIENGTILLDGALTVRTIDTPTSFLQNLAKIAGEKGNNIVAVSKQSELLVGGRSIRFWLNDKPRCCCYRLLSNIIKRDGELRVLGNVYAARFTNLGITFRMDVQAAPGKTDGEAIGRFYNSALMRGGYPDALVLAHAHSYFTSPHVLQLQAQAGAKYQFKPEPEVQLTGIFAPFGGRFK